MTGDHHDEDRSTIDRIVREYVSFINARDFESLRNVPYFESLTSSDLEYRYSSEDSLENHVNAFEEHCKEYPDRRIQILDLTITFDGDDRASAYLNGLMTNNDSVAIPGMTVITLRKRDGEWKATGTSSIRGPDPGEESSEHSQVASPVAPQKDDMSTSCLRETFSGNKSKKPVTITFEEDGPEAIKTMLMNHAKNFIELHNSTNITSLLSASWVAPYFMAGTANRTSADINMRTYVERQLQHLQKFPEFYTRLVNVQAELDPSSKTATVFVDTEHSGAPPGVKIPGIGILSWRADELSGKWFFWKLVVMRGNTGSEA